MRFGRALRTIPAQRDYDGVEFRLTKQSAKHWSGMFSYTYSRLWGNYTGLTSSDEADGGGGRNSPNNSRSFDEPQFSWNDNGGSSSGLLPTDRPNTFKGYTYYELPEGKHVHQQTSASSRSSTGLARNHLYGCGLRLAAGAWPVDVVDRGKWVDVTQDPTTGAVTVGTPLT